MAWEFLRPVLTANALATIQANPVLLAYFVIWGFVVLVIIGVAVYISFVTGKPYRKPKKSGNAKGGKGAAGKGGAGAGGAKAGEAAPAAQGRRGATMGSKFNFNVKLPSVSLPKVKLPSVGGLALKGLLKK